MQKTLYMCKAIKFMAKSKKRIRSKVIRILLRPRRLDLIIGRLRFRKNDDLRKKLENARFGKLAIVRSIITPEKFKLLKEIKERNPSSIYELAKSLRRDIKSIRQDLKQLEEVGFIKLERIKDKKRVRKTKPILALDRLNLIIDLV